MHNQLSVSDWTLLITAFVGAGAVVSSIVIMALKLQKSISNEFVEHRKLMYRLLRQRDRTILRIEYYLVKTSNGEYQPAASPLEMAVDGHGEEH